MYEDQVYEDSVIKLNCFDCLETWRPDWYGMDCAECGREGEFDCVEVIRDGGGYVALPSAATGEEYNLHGKGSTKTEAIRNLYRSARVRVAGPFLDHEHYAKIRRKDWLCNILLLGAFTSGIASLWYLAEVGGATGSVIGLIISFGCIFFKWQVERS